MEELRKIWLERLSLIEDLFSDYQNNPYDPARAHQLRVHIRELRALINFFKKDMPDEDYSNLKEALKEIAQLYGPLRELDVLNGYLSQVALAQPELSDVYYELFRYLENDRRKEMRKTMNDNRLEKVRTLLLQIKEMIETVDVQLIQELDPYISKKIKKKWKKLKTAYQDVDVKDYQTTHQIRIQAKRVRYIASYLQALTSQDLNKYRKKAKKIQLELGIIIDAHINQELLTAYADKIEDQEVRKLIDQIQQLER